MADATTVNNGATGLRSKRFIPLVAIGALALGYGGYRLWLAHQPVRVERHRRGAHDLGRLARRRTRQGGARARRRSRQGRASRCSCSSRAICPRRSCRRRAQLDAGAGDAREAGQGRAARGDRGGQGARRDGDGGAGSRRAPARGASRSSARRRACRRRRRRCRRPSSTPSRYRQLFARGAAARAELDNAETRAALGRRRSATRSSSSSTSSRTARAARSCSRRRRARPRRAPSEQLVKAGSRVEDIKAARGAVEAAQGKLDAINTMIDELVIKAPRDCRVESLDLRPGDILRPTPPAATLLEDDQLYVRIYVPETQIGHIARRPGRADHRRQLPGQGVPRRRRAHQRRRRILAAQPADRRRARRSGVRHAHRHHATAATQLRAGMAAFITVPK